jgi:hypothetical protein
VSQSSEGAWTTSCTISDLNSDGLADIYDVNYLAGDDIGRRVCTENGLPVACDPNLFAAAQDRLLQNVGNEAAIDFTGESGITKEDGKGLGILVADLLPSPSLELFVANDGEPNFLFESDGTGFSYSETALLSGLSLDSAGRSQACMGIASGDIDGDGDLDLTNFYREHNTLYLQTQPGQFEESTQEFGLFAPSLKMLGFGTQMLDANLDGWLDIAVVNGHVTDLSVDGTPYRMRPQFFVNEGGKRFTELRADVAGAWFDHEQLGRSMARVDWNRDGREDFVVSHLDTPAALMTNQSIRTGNYLKLYLRGVESHRDAIGARVSLVADGRELVRELTAGDGYQASNERVLVFGLGSATNASDVRITWPSGTVQQVPDLAANSTWTIVENGMPASQD